MSERTPVEPVPHDPAWAARAADGAVRAPGSNALKNDWITACEARAQAWRAARGS